MTPNSNTLRPVSENLQLKIYRFDIFKGSMAPDGKVTKIKSVGSAYIREGLSTYTVHLKALLKDTFYLLANNKPTITNADFVVLTREPAQRSGKKYFWNHVGEGRILDGANLGIMHLTWDFFGTQDIYMSLHPSSVSEVSELPQIAAEAS